MENQAIQRDDKLIGALTQLILNDALNTVLGEFERNTETNKRNGGHAGSPCRNGRNGGTRHG